MEFSLFDTAIGRCGIAWSEHGVTGVQLSEPREAETRARLLRRFPGAREAAPPHDVGRGQVGAPRACGFEPVNRVMTALAPS